MEWVSAITQGILLGGFYALLAAGLSFMFGVMGIVNLAHGASAVLGAYLGLWIMGATSLPWGVVLLIVIPVLAAIGWALQYFVLNRAISRGGLTPIIVTFGLSVIISSLLQQLFSADSRSIPSGGIGQLSIPLAPGLSVGVLPLITLVAGVVVIFGLQAYLDHTRQGRAMRAVSDDQEAARLMGIDNKRVYALATAIAMGTIAIAGVFLGLRTQFSPVYGDMVLIFAFEAVIIGGLGSLRGTLAGAMVLGLAQTIGGQIFPGYGVLAGHLVFLVLLAVRPQGIFNRNGVRA